MHGVWRTGTIASSDMCLYGFSLRFFLMEKHILNKHKSLLILNCINNNGHRVFCHIAIHENVARNPNNGIDLRLHEYKIFS
jgi:hypothetical protein